MPGAYIPAYIRAYPFLFIEDKAKGQRVVGIEAETPRLRTDRGVPLFQNGQPTKALTDAISLSESLRNSLTQAAAWAADLATADILEPRQAKIEFTAGPTVEIGGFLSVNREKLDAVPAARFLSWRGAGWLPPLYAHMFSGGNWPSFIELASDSLRTVQ